MKEYTVLHRTFIKGRHRNQGEFIRMSADDAKERKDAGLIAEGQLTEKEIEAALKKQATTRTSSTKAGTDNK